MNQTPATRYIPEALSLYLDLVRFFAAVSVVLYHTWDRFFPQYPIKWPGHEAVVVFFVLSGYVIAHTVNCPGVTFASYVQHRIARILPVAYTALILALVACLLKPELNKYSGLWWNTLSNALFIAQSGPLAVVAPLNPPFWSLNYEVWYYTIFGIWVFALPTWRVSLIIVAAFLAGPKILLLLPVWLMGVILYRHMPTLTKKLGWFFLFSSLVAAGLLTWLDVSDYLREQLYKAMPFAWRAHYSTQFLYDLILGVVVAVNFTAIASLGGIGKWLNYAAKPIRYCAGCTLSLYLFHGPLLVLIVDVFDIHSPLPFYASMAIGCLIAAELTERRIKWYRALVKLVVERATRWRKLVVRPPILR